MFVRGLETEEFLFGHPLIELQKFGLTFTLRKERWISKCIAISRGRIRMTYLVSSLRDSQFFNLPSHLCSPIGNITRIRPLALKRSLHILRVEFIRLILGFELQVLGLGFVVECKRFGVCGMCFGFALDSGGLLLLEFGELFDGRGECGFLSFRLGFDDLGERFGILDYYSKSSATLDIHKLWKLIDTHVQTWRA